MRYNSKQLFLIVLASSLLVQAAWIFALPAFRGIDEFDHVYKAEAVAGGQLTHNGTTGGGRGHLVEVRQDVVDAASRMCAWHPYTGHDNCHPVEHLQDGKVTVASAAATYNPVYYALVGTVAQPFPGASAVFVMRVVTALLSALLLAWAAVVTSSWSRTGWPLMTMAVACTPVLLYSTSVASPNGVGYAAAVLLWAAALSLVNAPQQPRFSALTIAATVVIVTHTTGIMWLGLCVISISLLQSRQAWMALVQRHKRRFTTSLIVTATITLLTLVWVVALKTNGLAAPNDSMPPLTAPTILRTQAVWALQTIATFPSRNEPAPAIVYALWLLAFALVMVLGMWRSSRRGRICMLVLLAFWVLVPTLLTVISYDSEGLAWQGRYALPLAVGFTAVAGAGLDRSLEIPNAFNLALGFVLGSAHAVSVGGVALHESSRALSVTLAPDSIPATMLLAGLTFIGGAAPLLALARHGALADEGKATPRIEAHA